MSIEHHNYGPPRGNVSGSKQIENYNIKFQRYLRDRLAGLGYSPQNDQIFLPSQFMAEVFSDYLHDIDAFYEEPESHTKENISRLIIKYLYRLEALRRCKNSRLGRGFIWKHPSNQRPQKLIWSDVLTRHQSSSRGEVNLCGLVLGIKADIEAAKDRAEQLAVAMSDGGKLPKEDGLQTLEHIPQTLQTLLQTLEHLLSSSRLSQSA